VQVPEGVAVVAGEDLGLEVGLVREEFRAIVAVDGEGGGDGSEGVEGRVKAPSAEETRAIGCYLKAGLKRICG